MRARVIQLSILLVVCLGGGSNVDAQSESDVAESSKPFLASVRMYPDFFHLCMSTFIAPNVLVTTAVCLLCITENCDFFVMVVKDRLEDLEAPIYNVTKTVVHPKYNGLSYKYDIGLLFLEKAALDVKILQLPAYAYNFFGVSATIYEWLFNRYDRQFHLKEKELITVSNSICSSILSEFVPSSFLCAYAEENFIMGLEDIGSPLISRGTYILGILPTRKMNSVSRVEKFESLFPNLDWITDTIIANLLK